MRLEAIHDGLHGQVLVRHVYHEVLRICAGALQRHAIETQEQTPCGKSRPLDNGLVEELEGK